MKSFKEIEEYASKHFIPIARKDFVEFFMDLIIKNDYREVLEIGSAIGYTTLHLASLNNVYVTTIEHDENRFKICEQNIKDFNLEDKIECIQDDALNIFISQKFDVIFIDAAKAKNILFFEKYKNNLKDNGIVIIDNMRLDDFKKNVSRKKALFYEQKLVELKMYLDNLKDYKVSYNDVGDGIAILKKL
ncbi:MAG: class I SAM-dependent methyltransferase [Erysipelotrichaceae bacterium]|nr:class I SAM-dependent methyltransferase [Erysipelotrichaceae bacterium]